MKRFVPLFAMVVSILAVSSCSVAVVVDFEAIGHFIIIAVGGVLGFFGGAFLGEKITKKSIEESSATKFLGYVGMIIGAMALAVLTIALE